MSPFDLSVQYMKSYDAPGPHKRRKGSVHGQQRGWWCGRILWLDSQDQRGGTITGCIKALACVILTLSPRLREAFQNLVVRFHLKAFFNQTFPPHKHFRKCSTNGMKSNPDIIAWTIKWTLPGALIWSHRITVWRQIRYESENLFAAGSSPTWNQWIIWSVMRNISMSSNIWAEYQMNWLNRLVSNYK